MPKVQSAEADMTAHTVTATFDDADVSPDQIVKALNEAGYTVGTPTKK